MRLINEGQTSDNPDGADAHQPPVLLRLGALDPPALSDALRTMADIAVIGPTTVVVDVAGLDDRHSLIGFALLMELNRRLGNAGGVLRVVNPPPRLAARLRACGIDTHWDMTTARVGGLTLRIGEQPDGQVHAARASRRVGASATHGDLMAVCLSLTEEYSGRVEAGTVVGAVAEATAQLLADGVRAGLGVAVEAMVRARLGRSDSNVSTA